MEQYTALVPGLMDNVPHDLGVLRGAEVAPLLGLQLRHLPCVAVREDHLDNSRKHIYFIYLVYFCHHMNQCISVI